MKIGPTTGELGWLVREGVKAMPDTATVLRLPDPPVRTPTGGYSTTRTAHHTTPCRLSASVLGAGDEQEGAGQEVGLMTYTLTMPPGTDLEPADQVGVTDATDGSSSLFEVRSVKRAASWNMSDAATLTEVQS